MNISLHDKLKTYIDSKGIELLKTILHEKIEIPTPKEYTEPQGYLKNKNIINLGEVQGNVDMSQEDFDKKLILKIRFLKGEKVGYKEDGFTEIYKLVNSFLKEPIISEFISETFLANNIFDWLVGTYIKEIKNVNLSDFIIKNCFESILEYRMHFPILFLESDNPFALGIVGFQYLTNEYLENLSLKIPEESRSEYIKGVSRYKGQFMVSCPVKAEKNKAIELAIETITFSIDILKVVSPTVDFPDVPIFFDVDFRNNYQIKNEVLIQPIADEANFTHQHYKTARPFEITKDIWIFLNERNLDLLHEFAIKTLNKKNELESLIANGIRNFAKAISTQDQHNRITKIFTVLESLLLPDDNSPIVDSVGKYLPKLVSKNFEEREIIIATVKEMYKVRSAMMHHGKKKEFNKKDLAIIQKCTRKLILQLILMSTSYSTKQQILKSIDDIINRA